MFTEHALSARLLIVIDAAITMLLLRYYVYFMPPLQLSCRRSAYALLRYADATPRVDMLMLMI